MSHDSQSPIISLDLFTTNPRKPAVQSTTTPNGTTKPLETPRYTPCLRSPLFPLKTILEASGCQLLHCQPRRESKGAEPSGAEQALAAAQPRAGFSQRQRVGRTQQQCTQLIGRRAVLSLTPGSASLRGFLSIWQHCHVFFAPLKNSAVFRQLERKEQ